VLSYHPPWLLFVPERAGGLVFHVRPWPGVLMLHFSTPAVLLEEDSDLFIGQARVDAGDEEVGVFVA
jgi:hypothetical protein